jgi:hypothetical protein
MAFLLFINFTAGITRLVFYSTISIVILSLNFVFLHPLNTNRPKAKEYEKNLRQHS